MLSESERRAFDDIAGLLEQDPGIQRASTDAVAQSAARAAAARTSRPTQVPQRGLGALVARLEARFHARMAGLGY